MRNTCEFHVIWHLRLFRSKLTIEPFAKMSVRKNVTEFIEKYKELECLWKVTDINYKNKQVRSKALEQLIPILKKIDEDANMDTVSKKINALRNSFNKEYNKVQASYQWSPADIHVPKLWYYNQMKFLVDRDPKKKTSCEIECIMTETSTDSQILYNIEDVEVPGSPNSQNSAITSVSEQDTQNTTINLKRKIKNEPTDDSNTVKRLDLSVTKSKPTFNAFGEHVAEKLRAMDENAAKYCIKIINDAIFHAEFNHLNQTSRILTDNQPHFQLVHKSTHKIHPNSP